MILVIFKISYYMLGKHLFFANAIHCSCLGAVFNLKIFILGYVLRFSFV